jgi:hypothetical protein
MRDRAIAAVDDALHEVHQLMRRETRSGGNDDKVERREERLERKEQQRDEQIEQKEIERQRRIDSR